MAGRSYLLGVVGTRTAPSMRLAPAHRGLLMETNASDLHAIPLCRYAVASGDMFYSEVNERVIYVSEMPGNGFRVWMQVADQGPVLAAGLCQIFLEYALACAAAGEHSQACAELEAFGRKVGQGLSVQIKMCAQAKAIADVAGYAIECVLKTMNVHFTLEQSGAERRYKLERCPLGLAAESSGMREIEMAYRGVNAMCQSMIDAIEPGLNVQTVHSADEEQVLFLVSPTCA